MGGQGCPEGSQGRRQQQPEQAPLLGLQVDNLIRLHFVDLAEGHDELSRRHIGGGQPAVPQFWQVHSTDMLLSVDTNL